MRKVLLAFTALITSILSVACQRTHEVVIVNPFAVSVVIEISQYHSEGFDGTRPRAFTPNLLIETRSISIDPNERVTVVFRDGGGGFWLRWRLVDPPPNSPETFTLDLIRDPPSIQIHR